MGALIPLPPTRRECATGHARSACLLFRQTSSIRSSTTPRLRAWAAAVASSALLASPLPAVAQSAPPQAAERQPGAVALAPPTGFKEVRLPAAGPRAATITAYFRLPETKPGEKRAAVVAMHGCGGLFNSAGSFSSRHASWADVLTKAGYAVVFPDSFNPRGYRQICTLKSNERPIRPAHRLHDALAALNWLATEPSVDGERTALLGWSHGGSSVLWAAATDAPAAKPDIRLAIAFYPGCRIPAGRLSWAPRVPLSILIGSADNWTRPEFCRELVKRHPAIHLQEYEGAVHGFDAPNSPRRTRRDAGLAPDPAAGVEVGTDPIARQAAIAEVLGRLAKAFGEN